MAVAVGGSHLALFPHWGYFSMSFPRPNLEEDDADLRRRLRLAYEDDGRHRLGLHSADAERQHHLAALCLGSSSSEMPG